MPGKLSKAMAPATASKLKSTVGKPDLYLIVSALTFPLSPQRGPYLTRLKSEEDTIYEQDILRDSSSTKPWLTYVTFKFQHGNVHEQAFVLERACEALPRSYKLWKMVENKVSIYIELG
jgi:pre-mRNA-splicing factor SYF1